MSDKDALLPCPFCGSQVTLLLKSIECDACLCEMPKGLAETTEQLVVSWNRRALTAQQPQSEAQEPVAEATAAINPDHPGTARWIKPLRKIDMGTKLYTTPPSGVREGMRRAAEVCKDRAEAWGHSDFQQSVISEARRREAEELADFFRAEAERLPQTHVVVPVDKLLGGVGDGMKPIGEASVQIMFATREDRNAWLRAAKEEGKS